MLFHFTVGHEHIYMLLFWWFELPDPAILGVVSTNVFRDLLRALHITLDWVV